MALRQTIMLHVLETKFNKRKHHICHQGETRQKVCVREKEGERGREKERGRKKERVHEKGLVE